MQKEFDYSGKCGRTNRARRSQKEEMSLKTYYINVTWDGDTITVSNIEGDTMTFPFTDPNVPLSQLNAVLRESFNPIRDIVPTVILDNISNVKLNASGYVVETGKTVGVLDQVLELDPAATLGTVWRARSCISPIMPGDAPAA